MNEEKEIHRCGNCVYFQTVEIEAGPTRPAKIKTFCRRRLHSGSMGSTAEVKMNMTRGVGLRPTGGRIEKVASFFPETMPGWWCGDYQAGAPSHEMRPSGENQA